MASFRSLFQEPDENLVFATKKYIECLGARVTNTTIEDDLLRHPNYPSMLSVSDCFTSWNIENAALQLDDPMSLHELSTPFMAAIAGNSSLHFIVVKELTPATVEVIDEKGIRTESFGQFVSTWRGTALLAELDEASGERDFEQKRRKEKLKSYRPALLASVALLAVGAALYNWTSYSISTLGLSLVNLVGIAISLMLVRTTISESTSGPGICQAGENFNCKRVLDSPASKIFGISASDIGLLFFSTGFAVTLMSRGIPSFYLTILTVAAIASLPYTFFSVIYQWRVVKAWCILCLSVQGLLWINFALAALSVDFSAAPAIAPVINSIAVLTVASVALTLLKPICTDAMQAKLWKRQYSQIKNNKEIFNAFLKAQPHLNPPSADVTPIILGNPESPNVITMVTNPYCTPCSLVHKKLEAVLESSEDLQIHFLMFACSTHAKAVTKHFFAMYHQGLDVAAAMADWYASNKDYNEFVKRFPIGNTDQYQQLADVHCTWAQNTNIPHTPYVFVNGFMSPEQYEIEEAAMLIQQ